MSGRKKIGCDSNGTLFWEVMATRLGFIGSEARKGGIWTADAILLTRNSILLHYLFGGPAS